MNQELLLVPNLVRPRVNTNGACCKESPFFAADKRQSSSEVCSIASKLRLDACPTTKPGCAKNDWQALHAQAPGSAPCNHELSCVHDRLEKNKKALCEATAQRAGGPAAPPAANSDAGDRLRHIPQLTGAKAVPAHQ